MYIGLPSVQAQIVTPVLKPSSRTEWLASLSVSVSPIWILKSRPSLVVTKHQFSASATFTGVFVNCTRLVIQYSLQLLGLKLIRLRQPANSLDYSHQASGVHTPAILLNSSVIAEVSPGVKALLITINPQLSMLSLYVVGTV